jgi:acetyltransferase
VTRTTSRYPVHLIDVVPMADGSRVTIRPTLPQDVDLLRTFFRTLSAESRYRRFMTPLLELPDQLAKRFADIDYHRHLALLAEMFNEAGQETVIAEARYVVDEKDPGTCEIALAVADEWQSHGIARALLGRLERQAIASGIRRMCADMLISNRAMRGLALRAGYAIRACRDDAEMARLEKVLPTSPNLPPGRPLAA